MWVKMYCQAGRPLEGSGNCTMGPPLLMTSWEGHSPQYMLSLTQVLKNKNIEVLIIMQMFSQRKDGEHSE